MHESLRPRNLFSTLIAGILLLTFLSACGSPFGGVSQPTNPLATALRAIDPADTSTPAYDLTAVYLREQNDTLQIRVDLLDFRNPKDLSLDIRIEDESAPEAIPFEVHIPSEDDTARITLDPSLATVIVEIPLSEIPSHPRVDISTPEDEISGLTPDGPIPTGTAPLLLTFYDTFAGRFPAEALRSWDGAHTGPRGERHGLKYLLDAVEEYQVPVVLLDLKKPANLSALDAMGVLPRVKELADEGLLILPKNETIQTLLKAASSPPESTLQTLERNFGLPISPLSYNTATTGFQFDFLEDITYLYRPLVGGVTYLPIATETEATQPTPDGPSLEVRRALLETALDADKKDILVLGGDFQNTTWGSPDMVSPMLAYFASRPYIHILATDDLTNFPTKWGRPQFQPAPSDERAEKLETLYQNLTIPVLDFVANWQGSPLSSCATDLDKDNQPECVLANGSYLAILDPQGARLTYFFAREGDTLHQLIGPSWLVAVGLSDPSTWELAAGEAADPGAYPGAFADIGDPFKAYEPTIEDSTIVFASLDGTRTKTFALADDGIEVEYQTQEPVRTQIPLLVDPEVRFTPDWAEKYRGENPPGGVNWGLVDGLRISIQVENIALRHRSCCEHAGARRQAQGDITILAFNESLPLLSSPEDPDFDYPPGHYVPFPMAIAEIKMDGGTSTIQLVVSP
jgi:hypothetical protein